MKTKKFILKGMLVAAITGLMVTGCKKETEDQDTTAASDDAAAEQTYNDVSNIADQAYKGSVNYKQAQEGSMLSTCAQVKLDTASGSNPDTITVTFGTGTYPTLSNCLCSDGRYRRGRIIVTFSGKYRDSASVHTITFDNYYVNDNQITGTKTVKNNGHNSSGNLNWTVTVNGSIILASGGGTITWNSTRTREWLSGANTPFNWLDDVYGIAGSQTGINAKGVSYSAVITKQLKVALNCHWITEGTLELTPAGKAKRTIDYGSGTCDNKATVTINNNTYTVNMK